MTAAPDAVAHGVSGARARPLRVLYYYGSSHIDSGSPKALLGLTDMLDRARVTPLFLASGEGPLIDAFRTRGVEIVRAERPSSVDYRHPLRTLTAVRRYARLLRSQRIDVLHVNELGWNLDLVLGAWLARVRVILHSHLPGDIAFQNLHRFIASRVLIVSDAQRHSITNFHRIRKKARVMYNPVELDRFADGQNLRGSLGLAPDDIVVGTLVTRLGKGIDVLLGMARELLPRHPRLVFLIAGRLGKGEEEFGRAMMAEAEASDLHGRVRFLGSRQDIPDLLATFDVFVLPTRAETFGIAVVEAMAAGLPVVASHVGGIPEIVTSPTMGITVHAVDIPSFTRALEDVITLTDLGRGMGRRGQKSLLGRLDTASLARQLHTLYDEVVSPG